MYRIGIFLFTPLMLFIPAASKAQTENWVGKTILPTKNFIQIKFTNPDGQVVVADKLDELSYQVIAHQGEWIKVRTHRGSEGWFNQADAVLLDNAVDHFSQQIKQNPKDAIAFSWRAAAWRLKGEPDIAIKDYADAIRLNPRESAFYNNRGNVWLEKLEVDKAISDYSDAIKLNSKYLLAYLNRGNAWLYKSRDDKAIADFTKVIQLEPSYISAYNDRGRAWLGKKEYGKAIDDFSKAIKLDSNYAYAYSNRGLAWNAQKKYRNALADFAEAVRADSKYVNAYNNYAWLLATCPDKTIRNGAKAVELATKACELTKWKSGYSMDTLAAAYAEHGKFKEAVKYQQMALEDANYAKSNRDSAMFRLDLYKQNKSYQEGLEKQDETN